MPPQFQRGGTTDRVMSALTRLETGLRLVDHVNTALAANNAAIAMARFQRAK